MALQDLNKTKIEWNGMELQMIMWPLAILSAYLTSYTCTMVKAIDRNYVSKPISNVELCSDILGI